MTSRTKRIRVLIADDHRIVAEGIRGLLESEFQLVGVATDGEGLIEMAAQMKPDVVVADISMPETNGLEAAGRIRESGIETRFVFLTMHADPAYAKRAMDEGASGFVLKHSASSELVQAIRAAMAGETFVTPSIQQRLSETTDEQAGRAAPEAEAARPDGPRLTPRQAEVLRLAATGLSAKEVAARLDISRRTVEFHKYRIMEEHELGSTADLIRFAVKHGFVAP